MRWNFLHNAVVPAVLVAVESTWASVLASSLLWAFNSGHRDVPFLALALPSVLAALSTAYFSSAPRLRALGAGSVVAAWLVGAVAFDAVVEGGGVLDVLHPWSLDSQPAGAAVLALVLCAIAAVRGAWLGRERVGLRSALTSVTLGAAVFFTLTFLAALQHGAAFSSLGRTCATLALIAAPCALAVVAFVYESDLERSASNHESAAPSALAFTSVLLPLIVVSVLALGLIALVGLAAPSSLSRIGNGISDAARPIGKAIAAIFRHAPTLHIHRHAPHPPSGATGATGSSRNPFQHVKAAPTPGWEVGLEIAFAVVVGIAVLLSVARIVMRALARSRSARTGRADGEVRESIFSVAHLIAQLRNLGSHGADDRAATPARGVAHDLPPAASVRGQYRRILERARAAGMGRRRDETPIELAERLSGPSLPGAGAFGNLTELYDAVRYGGTVESGADIERARALVEEVLGALDGPHDET